MFLSLGLNMSDPSLVLEEASEVSLLALFLPGIVISVR
jgi:hypothetical protein